MIDDSGCSELIDELSGEIKALKRDNARLRLALESVYHMIDTDAPIEDYTLETFGSWMNEAQIAIIKALNENRQAIESDQS